MITLVTSPDIYTESKNNLESMGINVVFSFNNQNVSKHLSYHTDMQLVKLSENFYVCAPECYDYYSKHLNELNVNLVKGNTYLSCNYPDDIAYNIIVGNSVAIHNFKHTDSLLKDLVSSKKLINVSQGYTSCTLCRLRDDAYITSDCGLYKILKSNGFDVLLINDKDILLTGFDRGFIGGASFMLSDDLLCVNGKIESHPDYAAIKSFALNYNINLLSLCDKPIMDIGSFVKI